MAGKSGRYRKALCRTDAEKVEMYFFQNGSELLKEEHPKMHILFMDIEMPGESGIDLAMEVNRKWPECRIIYLTNYWSYAMDVYETHHVYYIVKENSRKNCQPCWKRR